MNYIKLPCILVHVYSDFTTAEHPYYLVAPEGTTQDDPDLDEKVKSVRARVPHTQEWLEAHKDRRLINAYFALPNGVRISDYDPSHIDPEDARCG